MRGRRRWGLVAVAAPSVLGLTAFVPLAWAGLGEFFWSPAWLVLTSMILAGVFARHQILADLRCPRCGAPWAVRQGEGTKARGEDMQDLFEAMFERRAAVPRVCGTCGIRWGTPKSAVVEVEKAADVTRAGA
jgi:hypothetical protein